MPYSSVTVHGVALLCFPPSDAVFQGIARRIVEQLEAPAPHELERNLKPIYPNAVVRARDSLASLEGKAWYVYRDGRFSPYTPGPNWWESPGVARIVISNEGRYLDANPAALAMLKVSLEELVTLEPGAFTVEEYRANVPWILQLVRDAGELHSTSMLKPSGGGPLQPVEYHLVLNGDGEGRHVSWLRKVPEAAVVDELEREGV